MKIYFLFEVTIPVEVAGLNPPDEFEMAVELQKTMQDKGAQDAFRVVGGYAPAQQTDEATAAWIERANDALVAISRKRKSV